MSIDSQHDLTFLQSVTPTHPDSHLFLQFVVDDMRQRGFDIPVYLPVADTDWIGYDRQFVQHYLRHVSTLCGIAELQRRNTAALTEDVIATSDAAQARIAELAANVSSLQDRIDVLNAAHANVVASLNEARSRHASDIEYLSEQLMEEATNRNWCSDYDRFVTRVNERLLHELQPRERQYEIEATFVVTARTTIMATSYDDAQEQASSLDYDFRGYRNWTVEDVSGPDDVNVSES